MSYSDTVLADAPLLYWRLGDVDIPHDEPGHGHDGEIECNPGNEYSIQWNFPPLPPSVNDDTAVNATSFANLRMAYGSWMDASEFTAECWVRPEGQFGTETILSRHQDGGSLWVLRQEDLALKAYIVTAAGFQPVTASADLVPDDTYHVAMTYDGDWLRLYVDGVEDASAQVGAMVTSTPDFRVFGSGASGNERFYGAMDEVAYYGTALSSDAIAAHYAAGTASPTVPAGTAPSNDEIANAIEVTLVDGAWHSDGVLNTNATLDTREQASPNLYPQMYSVWYKYTPIVDDDSTPTVLHLDVSASDGPTYLNWYQGVPDGSGTLVFSGAVQPGTPYGDATLYPSGTRPTYFFRLAAPIIGVTYSLYATFVSGPTGADNPGGGGGGGGATELTLTGTEGNFEIDFTEANPFTLHYTPTFDGSMVIQATDPAGYQVSWAVQDGDGEDMQDSTGDLGVVWAYDQAMTILATPAEGTDPATVAFGWTYAERASSVLYLALEDDEIDETPAGFEIDVFNGQPGDTLTLSLIGPTNVFDFQTAVLDDSGILEGLIVRVPELEPGDYYLRVEGDTSGGEETPVTVTGEPLQHGDDTPKPAPTRPTTDPAQHWRFYDLRDPDTTYTFPANPASWTNIFPPNNFTHDRTTAVDGQDLTWQAADRPWRMEFTGFLDTQEEYEALMFWSQLRRRFWLIDHRNRAWLITIEQLDATAQVKPNKPWAHNYTVKTLVFMQG